jgi:hypothetical protein
MGLLLRATIILIPKFTGLFKVANPIIEIAAVTEQIVQITSVVPPQ